MEKMLQFGRELQAMSVQLCREYGKNETNKKALQVCDMGIIRAKMYPRERKQIF